VDAGEGDSELRALRRRLAADPRDLGARLQLAARYSELGLPDLALEHYRLAMAQFPESAAATLGLAKMLREMQEPASALAAIREAEARQPAGNWQLLSLKGILQDDQGDRTAAEASHRAAVNLEPKNAALRNNLGYNLYLQRRFEEAEAEFRGAIALDSSLDAAHDNLAAALASEDKPAAAQALAEWQRTAGTAGAHNNMAALLMEQERWREARAELMEALKERPDFAAALANLKLVAEHDGQPMPAPAALAKPAQAPQRTSFWSKILKNGSRSKTSSPGEGKSAGADGPTAEAAVAGRPANSADAAAKQ
jgi:Flp pilus assembly protein TadD